MIDAAVAAPTNNKKKHNSDWDDLSVSSCDAAADDYNNVIKAGCSYTYYPQSPSKKTPTFLNTSYVTEATVPVEESFTTSTTATSTNSPCEVSRLTVNTHTSILNITEEDEEDEEEDCLYDDEENFLFGSEEVVKACQLTPVTSVQDFQPACEDISDSRRDSPPTVAPLTPTCSSSSSVAARQPPETPPAYNQRCCELSGPSRSLNNVSFVDQMMDQLVHVCSNDEGTTTPVAADNLWEGYRHLLEYDILVLLGCMESPDPEEMEQLWSFGGSSKHPLSFDFLFCNQTPKQPLVVPHNNKQPHRQTWKQRCAKVHRIRQQHQLPTVQTGLLLLSPSSVTQLAPRRSSKSFDWDNTPHEEISAGYDSDPEVSFRSDTTRRTLFEHDDDDDDDPSTQVQQSLNLTWTLTWYNSQQPQPCSVWMERGTLIHNNSVMVEPALQWRHASTTVVSPKLYSLPLLQICRILKAEDCTLAEQNYVLVRKHCALVVRTSDEVEYVFETSCEQTRNDIVRRWKLAVARFAALAVMEDATTILHEFFVTSASLPAPLKEY